MKALLACTFSLALSFSAFADIYLPQVLAPAELISGEFSEGTLTRLSPEEVNEFRPWAMNARNQLTRAIEKNRTIPLADRLPKLEKAVQAAVARSGNRQYQTLMRFALNRGLLLVKELRAHSSMDDIGLQENALDLLQRSILVGLKFYETDLAFQQRVQQNHDGSVEIPHAAFAGEFMKQLHAGIVNVLDPSAQYRLMYKLIEMVNWDLSRDSRAPYFAETIVEAHDALQEISEMPASNDQDNLKVIRQLYGLKIIDIADTIQAEEINTARHTLVTSTSEKDKLEAIKILRQEMGPSNNAFMASRMIEQNLEVLDAIWGYLLTPDTTDMNLYLNLKNAYRATAANSINRKRILWLMKDYRTQENLQFLLSELISSSSSDSNTHHGLIHALQQQQPTNDNLNLMVSITRYHKESYVRSLLVQDLFSKVKTKESAKALQELAKTEKSDFVRTIINETLKKLPKP